MTKSDKTNAATDERRVNGVRIVSDDAETVEVMARMVAALPEELCQTMISIRRDAASRGYVVEMEDGLDRAELTQPIADGLARALGPLHDGIIVGASARNR